MRFSFLLAAPLALIGSVAAQNELNLNPEETDATSRAALPGTVNGDVLNRWSSAEFQYVGNWCTTSTTPASAVVRITGWVIVVQDQSGVSQENFDLAIVAEDPANPGQPDPNAPAILRTAPVPTPASPNMGAVAWIFTVTLTTPFEDANLVDQTFFSGSGLPINNAWTNDGLSIHMSSYYGLGPPFPQTHDNPSRLAPDATFTIDRVNNMVGQSADPRTQYIHLLTDAAVLRTGQDVVPTAQTSSMNPLYGMGGNYPDNAGTRTTPTYANRMGMGDGISFRVRDAAFPGAFAVLFLSNGWTPIKGFKVSQRINGAVPIDFTSLLIQLPQAQGILMADPTSGQTQTEIRPSYMAQGTLNNIGSGVLYFVGVVADLTTGMGALTNGQAVQTN